MKLKKNKLLHKFFGVASVFLLLLGFLTVFYSPQVLAAEGKWIDKASIRVGDTNFFNDDPFDPNNNAQSYIGNKHSEECWDKLWVTNFDQGGSQGKIQKYKQDPGGECQTDGGEEDVTLSDTNNKDVTAYQIDKNTIFMPVAPNRDQVQFGQSRAYSTARNVTFKRLNKDVEFCKQNDYIVQSEGLDKDLCTVFVRNADVPATGTSVWIESKIPAVRHAYCPTVTTWIPGGECQIDGMNIVFANNREFTTPSAEAGYVIDPNTDSATTAPGASQESPRCESSGGLTWVICPLINGLAELADGAFDNFIAPMLRTPPVDLANTNAPIFKVWVAMRNIANILLIVAMIVIVFGQAIGGGLVDAYTAKKVLPRILAAAIMINLSIYMVALAVDVTNVVGQGLSRLLYSPFEAVGEFRFQISNPTAGLGIGALFVGTGAAIWAAGAVVPYILLFVLLPLALAMLGVVFTLVLRMGLIQFLIVSSPVACVLYCLPNTEKYFKKWWDLFLKTLLVYPIIVLIFALADILAVTTTLAGKASPGAEQLPAEIIAIVLMVLPLFMIPYAFKLAGGAIGAVHGAILDKGKKGVEGIKGNVNDPNSLQNKVKRRAGENITMKQARLVDPSRDLGASRKDKLIGGFADKFGNVDARLAKYNLKSREEAEAMSATGRDALRYAAGGYQEGGKYYNSKGKEISKQTYKRGKQLYGSTPTGIAQNLEYALRKAQTDDDFKAFRHAYARNAQQNGWNQKEMNDVWAAATYPHKGGLAASEWYSSPKLESDGSVSFKDITNDVVSTTAPNGETKKSSYTSYVGDLTNTRLGHQLPARDQDYRAMLDRQTQLETKVDTHRASGATGPALTEEEATQLAHTYQVFDLASHEYSMVSPGTGGAAAGAAGGPAGPTINATAGTATAQPYIEQAQLQRKAAGLSLGNPTDDGKREIKYDGSKGGTSGVVHNAQVSGDVERSTLPRNVATP